MIMSRLFLPVVFSAVALAQALAREPFDLAVQTYRDARSTGNFDLAAARREEARSLLAKIPVDSPLLPNRVQAVAELYRSAGRRAQARAVIQETLSRADSLGQSHSTRIQLLNMLADSWQQDGNLLNALSYRERVVSATESAPPSAARGATQSRFIAAGNRASYIVVSEGKFGARLLSAGMPGNNTYMYQQLAELYRQLGRPESAAKVIAKLRSLIQDDPRALAAFYEREGELDQALALYKKQVEEAAANPQAQVWETINPLQSISNLYQRQEQWEGAAATLLQAVSRLEASGSPETRNQAVGMRLNLANLLQQAGQSQASEKAYQGLLAETADDRNGRQLQVLQAYANHLSSTHRAEEGEQLLKTYLANHADLQPSQEANVFFSLSQMAGSAGHQERADEYRRAAMEKQRAAQPRSAQEQLIGPDLQRAQAAVNQGNFDEAVALAVHALAAASLAQDREQIVWQVPSIAAALAVKKAPEKGDLLYQQLLLLLQTWAVDTTAPLVQALQQYARFVIGQKDRWGEAPSVIDRYRENLVATQGAETRDVEQAMLLRIEFARARGAQAEAIRAAEELLAFEESLSGSTSAPYMDAVQTAAEAYRFAGNLERALALHRQVIAISDRTVQGSESQRGFVRMNAALAFAHAGQFEEAERLANEAITIGKSLHPPQTDPFTEQLDQIRRMKIAPESRPARTDHWFDGSGVHDGQAASVSPLT